jgi:hypothetical protein
MAIKKKIAKKKTAKKKVSKKKSVRKTLNKKIQVLWDPWYSKMLEAVGEYMDSIAKREEPNYNARDERIVKALIEFYGFETDDIAPILEDVETHFLQNERKENH